MLLCQHVSARGLLRAPHAPQRRACPWAQHRHRSFAARAGDEDFTDNTSSHEDSVELEDTEAKSDEYTDVMQQRMGTSLTYRHEDGMNYNRILDDLIVGSCLQTPEDVDTLAKEEGVGTVLSLQENCDMEYFGLDLAPIQARCQERSDIMHRRFPIRDFDPFSLRQRLPGAVALLAREAKSNGGTAYIHCTAGLGRAPATALAFMWWVKGMPLDEAYEHLRSIRPCSPKLFAIRQATVDLLYGGPPTPVTVAVWRRGLVEKVQVAGLDVGWGNQVEAVWDPATHRFVLQRELPPGTYQFKFIMDGRWTYSADHNIIVDGDNTNNFLVVQPLNGSLEAAEARERIMRDGGNLTESELARIRDLLSQLGASASASEMVSWDLGKSTIAALMN